MGIWGLGKAVEASLFFNVLFSHLIWSLWRLIGISRISSKIWGCLKFVGSLSVSLLKIWAWCGLGVNLSWSRSLRFYWGTSGLLKKSCGTSYHLWWGHNPPEKEVPELCTWLWICDRFLFYNELRWDGLGIV